MLITRGFGRSATGSLGEGIEIILDVEEETVIAFDLEGDGDMGKTYSLKQGEGKRLVFTITKNGEAYNDLSGVNTLTFVMKKKKKDIETLIDKTKSDFSIEANVASLPFTAVETAGLAPGLYVGELTLGISPEDTDKSADILIEIERAVSV